VVIGLLVGIMWSVICHSCLDPKKLGGCLSCSRRRGSSLLVHSWLLCCCLMFFCGLG